MYIVYARLMLPIIEVAERSRFVETVSLSRRHAKTVMSWNVQFQEGFQIGDQCVPDPFPVPFRTGSIPRTADCERRPMSISCSSLVRARLPNEKGRLRQERHLHWETHIYVNCKINMKRNML